MNFSRIILQKGKERSLLHFHPWGFSGAIKKAEGNPSEGEIVEVFSADNKYLGTGHFHEGSIKVRLFSFEQTAIDSGFWYNKIKSAHSVRSRLGLTDNSSTNAYRLIHAEGDGMPGMIIDMYDDTAVIQSHTLGMHAVKSEIANALEKLYGTRLKNIYDKSADTMSKQEAVTVSNGFIKGDKSENIVKENDVKFYVNWVEGQKTGFFLDQRENRSLLQRYAKGKKVLNTFCYSGGFSIYALAGGATSVHSVDSSARATSLAIKNGELNNFAERHQVFTDDVFDFLKSDKEQYDLIILDPPAFAKHLSSVDKAMIGYRNLNTEAFKKIPAGGFVFTFSCSQVMEKQLFRKVVFQAAAQAKRNVRILHQLSQGPDHPISIYHPEGEYLKGLVLLVD